MDKMKMKAMMWALVVLMGLALITLCFTFYPNECFWVVMGSSGCLIVWAIYNIILEKLK
jgi:hypothetical protein